MGLRGLFLIFLATAIAWGDSPPSNPPPSNPSPGPGSLGNFLQQTQCAERILESRFLKSGLVAEPWDSLWYFSRDSDFLTQAVFDKEQWPQINIRVLEQSQWLAIKSEPKQGFRDLLERRRRILENAPREKLVLQLPDPEVTQAAWALLRKKADYLTTYHPDYYQWEGGVLHNRVTDESFNLNDSNLDPLEVFARLSTNDVLLARAENGDLAFVGGAVLFTSYWNPNELLGKTLRQIHDMPGATEKFHSGVDRVMERLQKYADVTVLRNNWFWRTDPTLFQHMDMDWMFPYIPFDTARMRNIGHRLYLRMERETFSAVPGFPRYVAFTLDSKVYPLRAVAAIPEVAERTLRGLERNPGGTVLSEHTELLRRYLQRAVSSE